jgi:hypothetical protein
MKDSSIWEKIEEDFTPELVEEQSKYNIPETVHQSPKQTSTRMMTTTTTTEEEEESTADDADDAAPALSPQQKSYRHYSSNLKLMWNVSIVNQVFERNAKYVLAKSF